MKKFFKIFLLVLLAALVLGTFYFLWKKSQPVVKKYQIEQVSIGNIEKRTVATGKVEPRNEILIKPQMSGIIAEVYKEAGDVVKAGDIVKVKVVEVDIPRKRIALTMRLDDEVVRTKQTHQKEPQTKQHKHGSHHHHAHDKQSQHQGNNAFAAAFANAKRSK